MDPVDPVDPVDRRRRVLALTDTGSAAATGLAADAEGIEDDFLAGLTPGDRRELGRILCDLHAALNPTTATTVPPTAAPITWARRARLRAGG